MSRREKIILAALVIACIIAGVMEGLDPSSGSRACDSAYSGYSAGIDCD